METNRFTEEEAFRFLETLEEENEGSLTGIIEAIQNTEQSLREVQYELQELDQKQDSNMTFFSPIGVCEEGEEKQELFRKAEQLKEEMLLLEEKLSRYKYRKEQLQGMKSLLLAAPKNVDNESVSKENTVLDKDHGMHILESHEHDRNRIARDLHDSSVQSLTCLVHKTELCLRLMDMDTIRVKLELQTMIDTIKTIINGMREIIYNLRPMSLENLGLAATIEAYCLQHKKNYDIEVEFQKQEKEPKLPFILMVTIYRILQEAGCNVVKHSGATKMYVTLSYENGTLILEVKDNGKGFDTKELLTSEKEKLHGFGLAMMKERTALLGGTIRIDSVSGEGTTVHVEVPLQEKEDIVGDD